MTLDTILLTCDLWVAIHGAFGGPREPVGAIRSGLQNAQVNIYSLQTLCGMFNDLHCQVILRELNQALDRRCPFEAIRRTSDIFVEGVSRFGKWSDPDLDRTCVQMKPYGAILI